MVYPDYYKKIVEDHPIENKDVIITFNTAGITVTKVPCNIDQITDIGKFTSGKVRYISTHHTLKFTAIDSIEYIRLSKLLNKFKDHVNSFIEKTDKKVTVKKKKKV